MSSKRRGGLGRGIGALIPTAPPAESAEPAASAAIGQTRTGAATPAGTSTDSAGNSAAASPGTEATSGGSASTGSPATETSSSSDEIAVDEIAVDGAPQSPDEPTDDGPELAPVPGATFAEIPIEQIHANAHQPRQVFDEQALDELTHSIREFGVLQPVVVRADPAGGYELVMGERRLRASTAAGLTAIPAVIRSTADDAMLRDALLENIHRSQLNPLEEAAAYQQLLAEFGVTHDELAQRIGRSRSHVSNTIRLMNLSVPVQRRVAAGVLSAGHARALLGLEDSDQQDELAARIVAEGLSVRATEELVSLAAKAGPPSARRVPTRRITAPAIAELADKLSDSFDTRVRVELGKRKGKITVEFGSIDDLERIVAMMAPQLATKPQRSAAQ